MNWTTALSEEVGRICYQLAGVDPRSPMGAAVLAARILGPASLSLERLSIAEAALVRGPSSARITLREGLPIGRINFLIAHELAHHIGDDRREFAGLTLEQREQICDAAAAWIVAPPEIFLHSARKHRGNVARLAANFSITETCAALRVAEVGGPGIAIVTPAKIYRRRFVGLTDEELRGGRVGPGVRKVRIVDEPDRHALAVRSLSVR